MSGSITKFTIVGLLIYLSGITLVAANLEQKVQAPQHNFPIAEQLSSSKLEQKRNKYLASRNWTIGYNTKENGGSFYIGWGQSDVKEKPSSVNFADSKVLAFESALLAAKGDFTRLSKSRIETESIQEFFSDGLSRAKDTSAGSIMMQLNDKIVGLSNASLDNLLEKLGVDPADFSLKKRQNLAKDAFTKTVTLKAMSSVSGIRPLATFEDNDSVGVIIVYSQKLRDQATAIARGNLIPGKQNIPGKASIQKQLNTSLSKNEDYIFQHGIRILQDEKGNPTIVSFAQSGVKATTNTSKFQLDFALKAARSAAKSLSFAQLAEFVNATVTLTDKTVLAESKLLDRIIEDDMISREENLTTGKLINNFLKQVAKVKLSGVNTFKTWTANHPDTGHLIVGEVSIWSPYLSNVAKSINRKSTVTKTAPKNKPTNKIRTNVNFESDASF